MVSKRLLLGFILIVVMTQLAIGKSHVVWGTTFGPPLREGNKMADGSKMRRNTIAVALPSRKVLKKNIWIRRLNRKKKPVSSWIKVPVRDVGPWFIDDQYWKKGKQPRSVSYYKKRRKRSDGKRVSNPAGIDLTWTVWQLLGVKKSKARLHSGYVEWRFNRPNRNKTRYVANRTGDVTEGAIKTTGKVASKLIEPVAGGLGKDVVKGTGKIVGKTVGGVIRGIGGLFGRKKRRRSR
jgi:hypothetical protein